jgi:probable addiction module antidote protein
MKKRTAAASAPWEFEDRLYEDLRDPEYASMYVNDALLDGDEIVFKTAVADVIRARGVVKIAKKAGINRCTVFKTLKPETRTSFTTIYSLLRACDIDLNTRPLLDRVKKKSKSAVRG